MHWFLTIVAASQAGVGGHGAWVLSTVWTSSFLPSSLFFFLIWKETSGTWGIDRKFIKAGHISGWLTSHHCCLGAWGGGQLLTETPSPETPILWLLSHFLPMIFGLSKGRRARREKCSCPHVITCYVYDEHESRALCLSWRVLRQLGVVFKGGELRFWTMVTKKWYYNTKIEAMVFLKTLDRSFRSSWEVGWLVFVGLEKPEPFLDNSEKLVVHRGLPGYFVLQ